MPTVHQCNHGLLSRVDDISGISGWTRTGTIVHLTVSTDTVAIGAAAMVGTEKVRVVGGMRLDEAAGNTAYLEMTDGGSAAVSPAHAGRIRYNETSEAFEASTNTGAYSALATLASGGWSRVGTIVQLTTVTDTVAIGAAAMVGTEKVRVVGDLRLEGNGLMVGDLEFVPNVDGEGSVGTAAKRFKLVRAVTVTSGDYAYDDPGCSVCGKPFREGDTIVHRVRGVESGVTYTVPVHSGC